MIYETIILPVLLYDCETWSLTLKEEKQDPEANILMRMGNGEKLHNEELPSLYRSSNIVRVIKFRMYVCRACSQNGEHGSLHEEELHSRYRSPNVVKMIKCRRWAENVASMGDTKILFKILNKLLSMS